MKKTEQPKENGEKSLELDDSIFDRVQDDINKLLDEDKESVKPNE